MKKNKGIILIICILALTLVGVTIAGQRKLKEESKNTESISISDKAEDNESASTDETDEKSEKREDIPMVDNTTGIPVLYYHSVTDEATDDENEKELRVPVSKFEEQMKYLKDNGYHTLSLDEFYGYITKGDKVPENAVLITFDDGFKNNYENAYPVLKKYGFKATIFVITSMVDNVDLYLTSEDIKKISSEGLVTIGSHTVGHEKLSATSKENTVKTLKDSKEFLEKASGLSVNSIAYPYGSYDDATLSSVKNAGYTIGFTTDMGWAKPNSDPFKVPRVYVNAKKDMDTFKERLTNPNYK